MKIYYLSSAPVLLPEHEQKLRQLGDLHLVEGVKLSPKQAAGQMPGAEIVILAAAGISQVDEEFFQALPSLRFITTTSTSHDWIDVAAAKRHSVVVSNCKGANAQSVAEGTWAMILNLSRRVHEYAVAARYSNASNFVDFTGIELAGKTLGVIGLGDIGQKVAKMGLGFGMKVIGYNRSQKNLSGVKQVSLSQLLAESDVISVAVPLTDQTKGMISEVELAQMKDQVILVNTADEKIVDKLAIIAAVKKRKVFGYGVETALLKPIAVDDEYFSCPTILAYPHNAFNTIEATRRVKDTWFQNVVKFVAGTPQNVVFAQ